MLQNCRKRLPRGHAALSFQITFKKKCLFQATLQPLPRIAAEARFYGIAVLQLPSEGRKGWDMAAEDSQGMGPHRNECRTETRDEIVGAPENTGFSRKMTTQDTFF